VARPPPTRLRLPTSGPSICPNLRHSPPPNDARGTVSPRAFERSQAGAVLREASTLDEFTDGFIDYRDGDRRLVGIDPDEHSPHARTHLRSGQISAIGLWREGHSDFEPFSHTSFESLCTPRTPVGRRPRTSQPFSYGRQDVGERSLYNRRPRSLAAADHRAPDPRVKQVGSWVSKG
jgi:hypothetical protein